MPRLLRKIKTTTLPTINLRKRTLQAKNRKKKHLSDTLTLFKHDTREKSECTILLNLN